MGVSVIVGVLLVLHHKPKPKKDNSLKSHVQNSALASSNFLSIIAIISVAFIASAYLAYVGIETSLIFQTLILVTVSITTSMILSIVAKRLITKLIEKRSKKNNY